MRYIYKYRIIKENTVTGARTGRPTIITKYKPLEIGKLYCHLGSSYNGFWRVLELVSKEEIRD